MIGEFGYVEYESVVGKTTFTMIFFVGNKSGSDFLHVLSEFFAARPWCPVMTTAFDSD